MWSAAPRTEKGKKNHSSAFFVSMSVLLYSSACSLAFLFFRILFCGHLHPRRKKKITHTLFFMSLSVLLYSSACLLVFLFLLYVDFSLFSAASSPCDATREKERVPINQSIVCMGDPRMRGGEILCSVVITEAI